jgi:hypothetical protein
MKIGDTLFFSPRHAFRDLDFTNPDQIALALPRQSRRVLLRTGRAVNRQQRRLRRRTRHLRRSRILGNHELGERAQRLARRQPQDRPCRNRQGMGILPPWPVARRAGQGLSAILVRNRQGGRRIRRHLRHQPRPSVAGSKDSVPGPLRPDGRKPKASRD